MALSMTTQIRMEDIEDITILRAGTVWRLTGTSGEKLVVKSEAANLSKASFNTSKAVMKTVDKVAGDTKALTEAEKSGIKMFAEGMRDVIAFMTQHKIPGAQPDGAVVNVLAQFQQNPHALWYKMPNQDLIDLKGALEARMGGTVDKNPMKAFAKALSDKGGLEALGRIIACDLFIANTDRINPKEGSKLTFGTRVFNLKVIKNISNLFLVSNGTSRSVTGMDFIDPGTGYRHYDMTLKEVKDSYDEDWLGEWLVDKKGRQSLCKAIVEDLEMVLTPNRKEYSPFTKLGRDAAKRLEKGMIEGARQIYAGMTNKYKAKQAPGGMASRLALLQQV